MVNNVYIVRNFLMRNKEITADSLCLYATSVGIYLTSKQASDILRGLARREQVRRLPYDFISDSGQSMAVYEQAGMVLRIRTVKARNDDSKDCVKDRFLLQEYWRPVR